MCKQTRFHFVYVHLLCSSLHESSLLIFSTFGILSLKLNIVMLEMKLESQLVAFGKCLSRQMFPITFQFRCFQFICVHFFEVKKLGQEFLYQRTVNVIVVFLQQQIFFTTPKMECNLVERFYLMKCIKPFNEINGMCSQSAIYSLPK